MSEFKFACPVCGQHIMCDTAQAGSVMDCPTCVQKIVSPRAPLSTDSRIILTGTKFSDKKSPAAPVHPSVAARAAAVAAPQPEPESKKSFPLPVIIAAVAVLAVGGAAFAFRGKIFNSTPAAPVVIVVTNVVTNAAPAKPKPATANKDKNWRMNLDTAGIPAAPVAGRIHGQNFTLEQVFFQANTLTLRAGTHGPLEFGVAVVFVGMKAADLSNKTINITPTSDGPPKISLRWLDGSGTPQKENFSDHYAMRVEFDELANNKLPGKIYLCTPDTEKSYLMGSFNANVIRPKPKAQ